MKKQDPLKYLPLVLAIIAALGWLYNLQAQVETKVCNKDFTALKTKVEDDGKYTIRELDQIHQKVNWIVDRLSKDKQK